ncbi:hypothetical protein LCGC14_3075490 [marine sediment metagenome]|uniref:Uncharacterized protein n=1 Tax=marine sediment metagenome TaxID=412755 RepID=A0A0F8X3A0_9ZZZZ
MIDTNESMVQDVVRQVLEQVQTGWGGRVPPTAGSSASPPITSAIPTAGAQISAAGVNRFGQFIY